MFKDKSKKFSISSNKSKLDQILWFVENYLPQKKNPGFQKKAFLNNLETETVKQFSKLNPLRFKNFIPYTKNTILSFTFGNWALPYLKLLKKIGITK